jgi:hypothetical protein
MSLALTLTTRHPSADSTVRVCNRGTEDAPKDRVRIETRGPCDPDDCTSIGCTGATLPALCTSCRREQRECLRTTHGKSAETGLPAIKD